MKPEPWNRSCSLMFGKDFVEPFVCLQWTSSTVMAADAQSKSHLDLWWPKLAGVDVASMASRHSWNLNGIRRSAIRKFCKNQMCNCVTFTVFLMSCLNPLKTWQWHFACMCMPYTTLVCSCALEVMRSWMSRRQQNKGLQHAIRVKSIRSFYGYHSCMEPKEICKLQKAAP